MTPPVIITKDGHTTVLGEVTDINLDALALLRPDQQLMQIVHWMFELGEDRHADILVELVEVASRASIALEMGDATCEMIEEIRNETGSSYSYVIEYAVRFLRANLDAEARWMDNLSNMHNADYHESYERAHGHPCPECQELAIP